MDKKKDILETQGEPFVFATLANKGVIKLVDNLIWNIKKVGMLNKLFIICADKITIDYYKDKSEIEVVEEDLCNIEDQSKYAEYGSQGFENIVIRKYPGIKKVLQETGKDVVFVDCDIGFWKDINSYYKSLGDLDFDVYCSSEPNYYYCTGFTIFRNNERVSRFIELHVSTHRKMSMLNKYVDDQTVFNYIVEQYAKFPRRLIPFILTKLVKKKSNNFAKWCLSKVGLLMLRVLKFPAKIVPLPESQFCNGHYLMTKGQWTSTGNLVDGIVREDMYIAHANWIKGVNNKINFLTKLNLF